MKIMHTMPSANRGEVDDSSKVLRFKSLLQIIDYQYRRHAVYILEIV